MLTGCKKESQGPDEYRNTDEHRRAIITEPTEEPREKSIKDNMLQRFLILLFGSKESRGKRMPIFEGICRLIKVNG